MTQEEKAKAYDKALRTCRQCEYICKTYVTHGGREDKSNPIWFCKRDELLKDVKPRQKGCGDFKK